MTRKSKNCGKKVSKDSLQCSNSAGTASMAMPIITSKNEEHDPSCQTLLDMYIHDYLIKKKLHSTAKSLRTELKMDSILQHGINSEANGYLSTCWSAFWDVYFSTKSPLLFQEGPAVEDFGAKPPTATAADPLKELKAKIRKYLDDERSLIPQNFQKLLDDEVLKTPLKQPTPSLQKFQSSEVPIIVIDDDKEQEDQLPHDGDHSFDPEELLKLLEDDRDAHRRSRGV